MHLYRVERVDDYLLGEIGTFSNYQEAWRKMEVESFNYRMETRILRSVFPTLRRLAKFQIRTLVAD